MAITETSVEQEVRIAARPETVFGFFTDPTLMVRWTGQQATLDPRPGGIYRLHVHGPNIERGEFVEIVPYSRIVFTFGWESGGTELLPPGSSTVEVTLVPDGEETVVRLSHRDLPAEAREGHARGWEHYLARLAVAAAGGDPGPDPWATREE